MQVPVRRLPQLLIVAASLLVAGGCERPVSKETHLANAESRLASNDLHGAGSEVLQVLRKEPDNGRARFIRACVVLALGNPEAALEDLDRAAGEPPAQVERVRYQALALQQRYQQIIDRTMQDSVSSEADRMRVRGMALTALGRYDEAMQTFDNGLGSDPNNVGLLTGKVRNFLAAGADEKTQDILERLLAMEPVDADAWLLRSAVHARARDFSAARRAVERGIAAARNPGVSEKLTMYSLLAEARINEHDLAGALDTTNRLTMMTTDAPVVHYLRGRIELENRNVTQALNQLQEAVSSAPAHASARLLFAQALLLKGTLERADSEISQVLAGHPENRDARRMKAQVHLMRGQPELARRLLTEGPRGESDLDAAWLVESSARTSGLVQDGLTYIERSIAAAPTDLARQIDLSNAYVAFGTRTRAVEILQDVPQMRSAAEHALPLEANLDGPGGARARRQIDTFLTEHGSTPEVLIAAGAQRLSVGDAEGGQDLLKRAAADDPHSVRARLMLAGLAVNGGQPAEAERLLNEILALDPRNERAQITRAELLLMRGDLAAAAKQLEVVVNTHPANSVAPLMVAAIDIRNAQVDKARARIAQALKVSNADERVVLGSALLLMRAGRAREAVQILQPVAASGGPFEVRIALGHAQLASGNETEARATFEQVLREQPGAEPALAAASALDVRQGKIEAALARIDGAAETGIPQPRLAELRGDLLVQAARPR